MSRKNLMEEWGELNSAISPKELARLESICDNPVEIAKTRIEEIEGEIIKKYPEGGEDVIYAVRVLSLDKPTYGIVSDGRSFEGDWREVNRSNIMLYIRRQTFISEEDRQMVIEYGNLMAFMKSLDNL